MERFRRQSQAYLLFSLPQLFIRLSSALLSHHGRESRYWRGYNIRHSWLDSVSVRRSRLVAQPNNRLTVNVAASVAAPERKRTLLIVNGLKVSVPPNVIIHPTARILNHANPTGNPIDPIGWPPWSPIHADVRRNV
jgi:hypothetical protein